MSADVTAARALPANRRLIWWTLAAGVIAGVVYLMATAKTGPVDPTEASHRQSHGTVVFMKRPGVHGDFWPWKCKDGVHADRAQCWEADDEAVFG